METNMLQAWQKIFYVLIVTWTIDIYSLYYWLPVLDFYASGTNLQTLDSHAHYVQGVAWDPLGKYVASLSSDRTCRIYINKPKKSKGSEKINYVCQQVISKAEHPLLDNSKVKIEQTIFWPFNYIRLICQIHNLLGFWNAVYKLSSLPWWDTAIFLQKTSLVSWWLVSTCACRYWFKQILFNYFLACTCILFWMASMLDSSVVHRCNILQEIR